MRSAYLFFICLLSVTTSVFADNNACVVVELAAETIRQYPEASNGWLAAFVHYGGNWGLPYKDSRYSNVVTFDSEWRRTGIHATGKCLPSIAAPGTIQSCRYEYRRCIHVVCKTPCYRSNSEPWIALCA